MPTYDYQCDKCDHSFELFQSITDPVKSKCPNCGKKSLRRLFGTGAAIVFKGSGFYQTDYRSESYKKGAEAEKKATSDSKGSGDKPSGGKSEKVKSDSGKTKDASASAKKKKAG